MNHLQELIALFRLKLESWRKKLAAPALALQPIPIPVRTPRRCDRRNEAFTMIEIAISLAVIGFALVAIIGILPFAMNTQKENRQETLINQDASVFLNAVRNGERGIDDLTNYVVEIRRASSNMVTRQVISNSYTFNWSSTTTPYPITNGFRIIGLLSTPRYDGVWSNYVVAFVRSLSGMASEKFPQNNTEVQDFSFTYRMLPEILPAGTNLFDPAWTNFGAVAVGDTNEWQMRSNLWILTLNTQTNYHDVRLLFRYPYIAGQTGKGRQMFRGSVSGLLIPTNEPGFLNLDYTLYFFEPRSYAQIKP